MTRMTKSPIDAARVDAVYQSQACATSSVSANTERYSSGRGGREIGPPPEASARGLVRSMEEIRNLVLTDATRIFRQSELKLCVVDTAVSPSGKSPFQIDVLALDQQGRSVVVMIDETLEYASGREMIGRAIVAASMMAQWKHQELFNLLSEESAEELGSFLECEVHEVNREQCILFVAGRYDNETLTAASWLREHHGVHIECLQALVQSEKSRHGPILLKAEG
jgi:hypothetical protein